MRDTPFSGSPARTQSVSCIEDFGQPGHNRLTFPFIDPLREYRWNDRPADLPPGVESIWIYGGPHASLSAQTLTGHWKACLAIFRQWGADGHVASIQLRILGPVTQPSGNGEARGLEIIAARLFPECAIPLLGLRPSEISDLTPDWPYPLRIAADTICKLAETGAPAELIAGQLSQLIRQKSETSAPKDNAITAALRAIRGNNGDLSITDLPKRVGLSERSLRRASLDHLGLSAKSYARFVRHQKLVQTMIKLPRPDWAGLALDFGYSDQAHMVRETKAMSGLTPRSLHIQRTGLSR